MKTFAKILLILVVAASGYGSTSIVDLDPRSGAETIANGARIKGIQKLTDTSGIVFTSSVIYRTVDGGANWVRLSLPIGDASVIAGAAFASEYRGWVVINDRADMWVEVAETLDGGNSWEIRATAAEVFGEDAYLDEASIRVSGSNLAVTFRMATSSNFEGKATFHSTDGGRTWTLLGRSVEKRRSDDTRATCSRDWMLKTNGSCADIKRGCVQETTLVDGLSRDLTPPEIKELTRLEKESQKFIDQNQSLLFPPGGSTRVSLNRGFDKCTAGTIAQMQTWWNASPLYDSNIYISGRNRACSQSQLNASWVTQVSAMGWGLIPTIVGYQSPCSSCTTCQKHSSDAPTAETQGRGEADIAVTDAANLGLTAGSVLYYDMERYDETVATPGCRTASTAFLKGWTERIRELGYRSGTYGSPRNAIDDWQFMPAASRMEAVWMARWDNVPSVWTYVSFSNFPTDVWNNHQRIKQWQAPHDETWGGVTFNIDGNNADGPVAGVAIPKNKNADFDGDRKTDISVYRPENGVWYVLNSATPTVSYVGFGLAADIPTPGDYDGDGRTDYAVFRPSDGVWHILTKAGNYSARAWGLNGDIPVAADYNGDGKTDMAIFRPSNGVWYIANSDSLATYTFVSWGLNGDKPVVGNYDGDGKADIAVYRPSSGAWWVLRSSDGSYTFTSLGLATDLPAQGDFDGDGKTDHAVYRPSNGFWYILRSSNGTLEYYNWGLNGDVPVPGEYDGDGQDDIAVFRPSDSVWYVWRSSGGFYGVKWGLPTDAAVPNAYLPR